MKRSAAILASLLVTYLVFPTSAFAAPAVQGEVAGVGSSLSGPASSSALAASNFDAFFVVALGSALFLAFTALAYLHRRPRGSSRRLSAATGN